jgi:hypothetical protein
MFWCKQPQTAEAEGETLIDSRNMPYINRLNLLKHGINVTELALLRSSHRDLQRTHISNKNFVNLIAIEATDKTLGALDRISSHSCPHTISRANICHLRRS